jgi:hypothetical protein
MAQLTFPVTMAGYRYEGAHSVYWLVHPFRAVLAHRVARGGSAAGYLVGVAALPAHWHYGERSVCVNPGFVISSGSFAWLEEGLKSNGMEFSNANDDPLLRMRKGV